MYFDNLACKTLKKVESNLNILNDLILILKKLAITTIFQNKFILNL